MFGWGSKIGLSLIVRHEKNKLHDPYSIGLFAKIRGKIADEILIGHIYQEQFHTFACISSKMVVFCRQQNLEEVLCHKDCLKYPSPCTFRKINVMIAYIQMTFCTRISFETRENSNQTRTPGGR